MKKMITIAICLLIASPLVCARELAEKEKEAISTAVQGKLIDPESARFKWPDLLDDSAIFYCGLVNSKNRMGGYSGDAPYLVALLREGVVIKAAVALSVGSSDWNSSESQAVLERCAVNGYGMLFLTR